METVVKVGLIIVGCLVAAGALFYSTKEKIESVTHSLPAISEIRLQGMAEVSFVNSQENKVVVSGPSDRVDNVSVTINDGMCTIFQKPHVTTFFSRKSNTPVRYTIHLNNLEKVDCKGNHVFKDSMIKGKNVVLKLSGLNKGAITLDAETFALHSVGNSILSFEGTAKNQTIISSGALEYNSEKLKSEMASLKTTGVATLKLGRVKKIDGAVSRTTTLEYQGKPTLALKQSNVSRKKTIQNG